MGGLDENKTVLDSGEKYDPDSNTWSPIPPMLQVSPAPPVLQVSAAPSEAPSPRCYR